MEEILKIFNAYDKGVDFSKEQNIMTSGILDSIEMVELIEALENTFNVEIPLDMIMPENFDSVELIWKNISELM